MPSNHVNPFASKVGQAEFKERPEAGVASQISFSNEDFWKGMSKAFGLGMNEEIIGVVLGNDSIKARFRVKPTRR